MSTQTLQYVINANASGFVSAVGQAEAKFGQALQGMSGKAARIQLFEQTQQSAKEAAKDYFKLKKEVDAYQQALVGARGPLAAFQQGMAATELAVRQGGTEVRQQALHLKTLEAAQKSASAAYAEIRKAALAAGGNAEEYAGELAQAKRQLDAATAALAAHKTAMANAAKEYANNKAALATYKAEAAAANKPVKDLETQLARAERGLAQAETKMRSGATAVAGLRKELTAAGIDTRNLATEQERMAAKVATVSQRLNPSRRLDAGRSLLGVESEADITRQIRQVQAAYQRLASSGKLSWSEQVAAAQAMQAKVAELRGALAASPASGFLSAFRSEIVGAMLALGSLTAAIHATNNVLTVGGQFEALQVQLNNVEKSSVLGTKAMADMKQMALDSPFGVKGLTQSYAQLKNFGLDPMSGALQAATNQAAKLSGTQETLSRITLALGQAWSKEKLQGEEALQLIEAGVPVWELLGRKLNKTASELQTLASNGQLGRDAIRQLIQAMEEDAKGAAASNVGTWEGMLSQLQDIWDQFLNMVSENGAMDAAKEQVRALMDAIRQAMQDGTAVEMGKSIAAAIRAIGEVARLTVGFIREHADAIKLMLGVWVGGKILQEAIGWLGGLAGALNAVRAVSSIKVAVAIAADSAGIARAMGEITGLLKVIRALPLTMALGIGVVGAAAAVVAIDAVLEATERLNAAAARRNQLHQQFIDLAKSGVTEVDTMTAAQLDGMSKVERARYENDLRRALATKQNLLHQRQEDVGDITEDATAKRLAKEAWAYQQALDDYRRYGQQRLTLEETFSKNVEGVRRGALANLADSLAKEQKLYDRANETFKTSVEARQRHQDAWASRNATDPAAKAKAPEDLGVTDYYDARSKALALANKAAGSFQQSQRTGRDVDFRQYQREAQAAEKAFDALAETIARLREAGKITEGEFAFFNDESARLQDGFDAQAETAAKNNLQAVMEKLEALKQAADQVKNLKVGFDTEKGVFDLENLMARFQQMADAKPVRIPVEYVDPDGKYLQEARQTLGLPSIQKNAAGGLIAGPGTGTSDSILSWLSNGEFVVRASAVEHYGPALLQAINQQRLPRFAEGGLVAKLPAMPSPLADLPSLRFSQPNAAAPLQPVNLYLPGQSAPVALSGSTDAVKQLVDAARTLNLKFG